MTVLDLVRLEHPAAAAVPASLEDGVYHPDEFAPSGDFVYFEKRLS
jgi:hypothetical protein